MQVKTALVTGSSGFIGRHMSRVLDASGYHVFGIDTVTGHDARDFFRSDDSRFNVVIHAAAVVGGRQVISGNPMAQAVNLELDAAMFAWARRTGPDRVVYLSSSSAYPVWLQSADYHRHLSESDIDLSNPDQPDALYGWCKLTGERLARLSRQDRLNVTVARPFSGYGEDQDECYPFPAFAARIRRRDSPFVIWGSDKQTRDWIHVDDICQAIMVMVNEGIDGPVNLGSGEGVSMAQLASWMMTLADFNAPVEVQPKEAMGVVHRVANTELMRQFYLPRVTLEEGINRALKMGD